MLRYSLLLMPVCAKCWTFFPLLLMFLFGAEAAEGVLLRNRSGSRRRQSYEHWTGDERKNSTGNRETQVWVSKSRTRFIPIDSTSHTPHTWPTPPSASDLNVPAAAWTLSILFRDETQRQLIINVFSCKLAPQSGAVEQKRSKLTAKPNGEEDDETCLGSKHIFMTPKTFCPRRIRISGKQEDEEENQTDVICT